MNEISRLQVNIYHPVSFMNTNSYRDSVVDHILNIRKKVLDTFGKMPSLKMSEQTYAWLYRLFYKDGTFIFKGIDNISFWGMIIERDDVDNGIIYFTVED